MRGGCGPSGAVALGKLGRSGAEARVGRAGERKKRPAAGLDCWAAGREEVSWAREKKWATGFGLDLSFGFLGWVLGVWVSFS